MGPAHLGGLFLPVLFLLGRTFPFLTGWYYLWQEIILVICVLTVGIILVNFRASGALREGGGEPARLGGPLGLPLTYLAVQWVFFVACGLHPGSFLVYGLERGDWGAWGAC